MLVFSSFVFSFFKDHLSFILIFFVFCLNKQIKDNKYYFEDK